MVNDKSAMKSIYSVDLRLASTSLYEELMTLDTLEPSRQLSIVEQWASTSTPTATQSDLIDALSHIILHPLCTETVAVRFHPLLLEILTRSAERVEASESGWSEPIIRPLYHTLARLLAPFPAILPIVALFISSSKLRPLPLIEEQGELEAFLLSTYRLIHSSPNILHASGADWSSSVFLGVARSSSGSSNGVKLLALRIFAIMERVSEAVHEGLQLQLVGFPSHLREGAEVGANALMSIMSGTLLVEEVDGWVLPLQEAKRVRFVRSAASRHCTEVGENVLDPTQLASQTASVGGILFHRQSPLVPLQDSYRETESLQTILYNLGQKLAANLPILLSGPEACGKTSLIRHVCLVLQPNALINPIMTLQLGDQSGIDAKSLIGSFISSTKTPGTFEWVEGALTRAVRLGKWVVLEDIDRASGEVLSVIKPLVEDMCRSKQVGARPSLDLGSRGRVEAGSTFALFSTRTTPLQKEGGSTPRPTYFGHEHWQEVEMKALRQDDILAIVKSNNELLSLAQDGTCERLISTWLKFTSAASNRSLSSLTRDRQSAAGTVRVPSFHDLLKWCRRIEACLKKSGSAAATISRAPLSNQALQEEIAIDACDIFLGSTPPSYFSASPDQGLNGKGMLHGANDRYSTLIELLANELGVDRMAIWHNVAERRPEFKLETSDGQGGKKVIIGRSQIQRSSVGAAAVQPISRNFALTGPAARLMERIAVCVSLGEPTLLVGETGTGKTTVVQHLASLVRKPLVALNLSQQTETSDLLGGFKPLDPKLPAMELHNQWVNLFQQTFSSRRNGAFLKAERKALQAENWKRLYGTWREAVRLALDKLTRIEKHTSASERAEEEERATKIRRLTNGGGKQDQASSYSPQENDALSKRWMEFQDQIETFAMQYTTKKRHLVFSFVEGPLVKAIRSGSWVLLDEINLATSETLDCLTALLQSPDSSIVLTEKGDLEPVTRHADFRLFACMNPATDVGKKDLPNSLRSRFTELYAPSPDSDQEALLSIVEKYIGQESVGDRSLIMDVAQTYSQIRLLSQQHQLADGANQRPHYSVRTLSRALTFAKDICAVYGLRRGVWEGFIMTFTMLLDSKSAATVNDVIKREIMSKAKNANAAALFVPVKPTNGSASYAQIGSFWIETGAFPLDLAVDYVLTPSVQDKLVGLARAALTRRSPVLIQGPTSAGKTSAIEYLARRTGHKFVRINNHEHTDIQEYIGSYSSDPDSGRLEFHEGLLVTALRQGHWIVLDELNLAPTDVLEALNRLLDDNRELVIPETGQVITPHPHFMLFATQNPPGLYAGRKVLSRAFRNRFLEIHFQDVPQAELQTILTNRCQMAPSYAEKIVQVFRELQRRRQAGRVFDTKQAFVTLRDLFRWGSRQADNYQQLAENGYILIAERARKPEDALVVKQVIEEVINVKIDTSKLYDIFSVDVLTDRVGAHLAEAMHTSIEGTGIVWTSSMQRLACLIASSLRYNEPVLLVGETGSGKTSVCQILANVFGQSLMTVNCHQSTDTADLIGGQRPLRNRSVLQEAARRQGVEVLSRRGVLLDDGADLNSVLAHLLKLSSAKGEDKEEDEASLGAAAAISQINHALSLFEWNDGPLVQAMKTGNHLLLDEISLADDSVLERLNSVLESGRTLVLAEKSNSNIDQSIEIKADASFQVIATMNPGGDYGKKELSPALRNRFTEIWVPSVSERDDLLQIVNSQWKETPLDSGMREWAEKMVDFLSFYTNELGGRDVKAVGLRDLIAWARFMNAMQATDPTSMSVKEAFVNGAFMTLIDGVALHSWVATKSRQQIRAVINTLSSRIFHVADFDEAARARLTSIQISSSDAQFCLGNFTYPKGQDSVLETSLSQFNFVASTPSKNAVRVLRAMQISERAVMLEGSPGAGKTSLIVALARECNYKLTRINLSDQTELSDLFGADLPVEGGKAGEFDWRDAAFLQAMQEGSWVLLDEMNLASQTVLEGLNSCLDHRGSVYLPELGRTFTKHADFRIFAAQNPQHQGGGRKGLPKSFLNRFTKVYIEELQDHDFFDILTTIKPDFHQEVLTKMIQFNGRLQALLQDSTLFSKMGQPWEFNLRDLLRWLVMIHSHLGLNSTPTDPIEYFGSLYLLRFRTRQDRIRVAQLYERIFGVEPKINQRPWFSISTAHFQIGHVVLARRPQRPPFQRRVNFALSKNHLAILQSLGECVQLKWPSILVGESRSGKTTLVRRLAELSNCKLEEVKLNSGTDAIDVVGGFQQVDGKEEVAHLLTIVLSIIQSIQTSITALLTMSDDDLHSFWKAQSFFNEQLALLEREDTVTAAAAATPIAWQSIISAISHLERSELISERDREIVAHASTRLSTLSQQGPSRSSGKFAWIDGPVLRAMRQGCWLLLDDANLCSSSVLDRLNSLLEPGGNLVLSERGVVDSGVVEVIEPHPDFRIFFALDPRHGELSRAMRNRGLEIYMEPFHDEEREGHEEDWIGDATLQSAQTWTEPVEAQREDKYSHKMSMQLALLGRALSPLQLHIAHHIVKEEQIRHLQILLNSTLIAETSLTLKSHLKLTSTVNASFVDEMGFDLQLNPNTFQRESKEQSSFSHVLELLVKTSTFLAYLQSATAGITRSDSQEEASILQKSALYSRGQEIEQLSRQDRHLFSLVVSVAGGLQGRLRADLTMNDGMTRVIQYLLDCSGFLTLKWSSATLNDYSISKIVIEKMQSALTDLSKLGMPSMDDVEDEIDSVSRQIKLTSGHAMHQIWRCFLPSVFEPEALNLAVCITQYLSEKGKRVSQDLVSNAVDVAATLLEDHSQWTEEERGELISVARRVISALKQDQKRSQQEGQEEQEEQQKETSPNDDYLLLCALLLRVSYSNKEETSNAQRRQTSLMEHIKTDEAFPKDVAVSLKSTAALSCSAKLPAVSKSSLSWVKGIFLSAPLQASQAGNTQDLFRPLLLFSVLQRCSSTVKTSFSELQVKKEQIKTLVEIVGHISPNASESRSQAMDVLLLSSINAISAALVQALCEQFNVLGAEEQLHKVVQSSSSTDRRDRITAVINLPTLSDDCKALAMDIMSSMDQAIVLEESDDVSLKDKGIAALQFGLTSINAFLPNIAIDPLVAQQTEEDLQMYRRDRLEEEKAAALDVEKRVTGNVSSPLIQSIETSLAAIPASGDVASKAGRRDILKRETSTDLLQKLHSELFAFSKQVLNESKMEELWNKHMDSDVIVGRLRNLQSTICAMLERLPVIYRSIWDLTRPFEHSLSVILLGLGMLLQAITVESRSKTVTRNEAIIDSVVTFPTSLATKKLILQEIPMQLRAESTLGSMLVPLLLMKARAVVFDLKGSSNNWTKGSVSVLRDCYDQLWHLWTLDEEHQKQQREEEQSLYKVKRLDMTAEEEATMEEEEFLQYFPQYTDLMEESGVHPNQSIGAQRRKPAGKAGTFFGPLHVQNLFSVHLSLFEHVKLEEQDTFEGARVEVLQRLMHSSYGDLSEQLDRQSATLQISLFDQTLSLHHESSSEMERDFYVDANPVEAIKLQAVVERMVRRLDGLIRDWPDQEVLQHIKQRCQLILGLDSSNPINQLLHSLEGLLHHAEDWKTFASSKTSLQAHQDEIIALIIEWRRLELKGWKSLLNKESTRSRSSVCDMWFTLFQVIVKVDYEGEEEEEKNVSELVSLLDQYLRGSTLGQYSTRLQLVHSFAAYLSVLRGRMGEAKVLKVELLLSNIHRFFAQFECKVVERLDGKRKILEKEISDYVKLASWKDTNIHALKVSADKTHRKLHRCLRKFRDALNEGVDPVLAGISDTKELAEAYNGIDAMLSVIPTLSSSGASDAMQAWHEVDTTALHLIKLPTTLQSLHSMYQKSICHLLDNESRTWALLDLSSTIIIRSEALAKQTPTIWKQENDKLVKHLETRKRKAWSDLLRELRRIGLTVSSIDGVSSSEATKTSVIYIVPLLQADVKGTHTVDLAEADNIHYRLLSLLPVLRSTINSSTRNLDVHVSQLQRGLSFVENGFLASLVERRKLSQLLTQLRWIDQVQARISDLVDGAGDGLRSLATTFDGGAASESQLVRCLDNWRRLQSGLEEILGKASKHIRVLPFGSQGTDENLSNIAQCQAEVASFVARVQNLSDYFEASRCTLISVDEYQDVLSASTVLDRVEAVLGRTALEAPSLQSMCISTLDWLRSARYGFSMETESGDRKTPLEQSKSIGQQSDRIISSILVIAQELLKLSSRSTAEGEKEGDGDELPDRALVTERLHLTQIQRALRISHLKEEVEQLFKLSDRTSVVSKAALARLQPFLSMYKIFVENFVGGSSKWYRGLLKLNATLCKLVTSLASNGFCKPRQEEEQSGEAGNDKEEQLEGGMGLGEGEGAEDVTDTLKDDEMMEELQQEKTAEKEDGETKGEKNAKEMEDDFDGDMGDVEKGDDEEEGDDDDDDEEDEQQDVEEGVGEVDPLDLDAVDEKTWGGQDEEEKEEGKDKSEKEKAGQDSKNEKGEESKEAPKASEEGKDDEGAEGAGQRGQEEDSGDRGEEGKEKEGIEQGEEEEEDPNKEEKTEEGAEEKADEGEDGSGEEQEEQEQGDGLGRAIDQEAQQAENLELDEDLQMDNDGDEKSDGDGDSEMDNLSALDGDEEKEQERGGNDDEISAEEQLETTKLNDDDPRDADKEGEEEEEEEEEEVPHGAGEDPMDEDDGAQNGAEVKEVQDQAETQQEQQKQEGESGLIDDTPADDATMRGDASQDTSSNQQQSAKSSTGRQTEANEDAFASSEGQARKEENLLNDRTSQPKKDQSEGGRKQAEDQGRKGESQGEEDSEREEEERQPARSLGDALKEFKRNMDSIEESLGEEAREEGTGMPDEEPSQVEHVQIDEDSEMQALGVAQNEEAVHTLDDLAMEDDDQTEGMEEALTRLDEEMQQIEAKERFQPSDASDQEQEKDKVDANMEDKQGGLMTSDVKAGMDDDQDDRVDAEEEEEEEQEEEEMEEIQSEDLKLDESIESRMEALFTSTDLQQRLEIAQELWKSHLESTADYAFTLSEQLRLILAPTKATKLTGDFKTGKRLNMRKIIPFIASDYLKDKIWLRRNLAQKREYQVLLSIDDSKSMLESKNMLLAFKSLALVCSALDKLEVGQIGVMKFGREVELLKGFGVGGSSGGQTIQDQEGAKILERLQFQQKGTDVSTMLQKSFNVLMEARENQSVTSSQLWQLQIIISDGVCQDHNKLQSLLRRANEEKIMIVFVILDSLQQNSSILTMNSVNYTTGANGRPQLQMNRYLDSFPFEYFIVVRDVADLPDVLSTTLRQWAQKIAEA
ncbi:hypothetical protein CBS101457_003804 [Exobasidium rhododendri]|nr:hypothetical protein CBS101457_003804 [Exobasidium rhododendri]